jgi:hypothetical protein
MYVSLPIDIDIQVTDNATGLIILTWNEVMPTVLGTHTRILSATDAAGNVTQRVIEITIRLPRVLVHVVSVNGQSIVFSLNEQTFLVDSFKTQIAIAKANAVLQTLDWQSYQEVVPLAADDVLYVSLVDAQGERLVREISPLRVVSIDNPLPDEPAPLMGPASPQSATTLALILQSVALLGSLSTIGWLSWTTFAKKPL